MQYSIEESALIGGLITEYFSRASVSDSVRLAYRQVYQHLMDGHLTQDDLGRIQAALDFLLPVFPAEREVQYSVKGLTIMLPPPSYRKVLICRSVRRRPRTAPAA